MRSHKSKNPNSRKYRHVVARPGTKGGGPQMSERGKLGLVESMIVRKGGYGSLQELEARLSALDVKNPSSATLGTAGGV